MKASKSCHRNIASNIVQITCWPLTPTMILKLTMAKWPYMTAKCANESLSFPLTSYRSISSSDKIPGGMMHHQLANSNNG